MNYLNALPGQRALLDDIGALETLREKERQGPSGLTPTRAQEIAARLRALREQLGQTREVGRG